MTWALLLDYPALPVFAPCALRYKAFCGITRFLSLQGLFLRCLSFLILDLLWVTCPHKEDKLFAKIHWSVCVTFWEKSCGFIAWHDHWGHFCFTGNSKVYSPRGPGLAKVSISQFCVLILAEAFLLLFREYEVRRSTVVMVVEILKIGVDSRNSRNRNKVIVAETY